MVLVLVLEQRHQEALALGRHCARPVHRLYRLSTDTLLPPADRKLSPSSFPGSLYILTTDASSRASAPYDFVDNYTDVHILSALHYRPAPILPRRPRHALVFGHFVFLDLSLPFAFVAGGILFEIVDPPRHESW